MIGEGRCAFWEAHGPGHVRDLAIAAAISHAADAADGVGQGDVGEYDVGELEEGELVAPGIKDTKDDRDRDALRIWEESLRQAAQPTLEKMIRELAAELKSE